MRLRGLLFAFSTLLFFHNSTFARTDYHEMPGIPGAVGDGTTDDSTAFGRYFATLPPTGGSVPLAKEARYYIGRDITIPANTILDCQQSPGLSSSSAGSFSTLGGIRLDKDAKIIMSAGSRITNCPIFRFGLTFPQVDAANYAGTAISFPPGATTNTPDVWLMNDLIVGFATCVDQSGTADRLHLLYVECDAVNGYKLGPIFDTAVLIAVRNWPWGTWPNGVLTRAGTGFLLVGNARDDDIKAFGVVDFGHAIGMDFENPGGSCCNGHWDNVWLDNNGTAALKIGSRAGAVSFGKLWIWSAGIGILNNSSQTILSVANLEVHDVAADCVQLNGGRLDATWVWLSRCGAAAVKLTTPESRLHIGGGGFDAIANNPQIALPAAAGMPSDAVSVNVRTDGSLYANNSLLPQSSVGATLTATAGISAPTQTIAGLGQTAAALADGGHMGGSLMLKDTGTAAGSGGALLFGQNTHMRHFAAIKGLAVSGNNNTSGDLALSLRANASDPTLTEAVHFDHTGYVRLSRALPAKDLSPCGARLEGAMQAVTDSKPSTWGALLAGGGTNHVLAYCNGTHWTVMAK